VKSDEINSPAHYAGDGRQFEVIEVLEDWAGRAPDPVQACLLFSCLKYLGRLYDKGSAETNAKKALWYLERLIQKIQKGETEPHYLPDVSFVTYDDLVSAEKDVKEEFGITGYEMYFE
jgi:hypothetical protein|tara:strand:+ start:491 stop:844 length:354 start_codon:yes stop_codon:yes gene_type:complete